ncbi:MAG TPA: 5-deoxy-glucuronate isomerase [Nitrososphaerales archaeon]|nr:5-deoxy-glucuronate isomerase [Nitrososphaerales archaeon]
MLIKDKKQVYDTLVPIFDHQGYAMYCYKSRSRFTKKLSNLAPNGKERIVFSLKGPILVNGNKLEEKDMAYIPVDQSVEIGSDGEAILFIAETHGAKKYDPYIRRYKDAPRMQIGQPTFRRSVVVTIGEKDPANRFIAGYVEDSLGEWSSYPPHKHDDKPEAYLFYGVDPGFAVQLVLDGDDEKAFVVHDYDTVLIPKGYHPHVNTSLTGSNYAWIISAPPDNRNLGVDIHPAFKNVNLGRSHLTIHEKSK